MRRLYRSRTDRMVGGVCAGLASYFGLDPTLVRIAFVVLAVAKGVGVALYLVLWVLVPEEPIEGGAIVSDETPSTMPEPVAPVPVPVPEPGQPAEPAMPAGATTYSAPTAADAPAVAPPPAAAQQPPAWTAPVAPQPVSGPPSREVRRGGITGGVILIIIGLVFLASEFVPGLDIGKLWPLILVGIGIAIIFRRR